jgi:hypothetical protein
MMRKLIELSIEKDEVETGGDVIGRNILIFTSTSKENHKKPPETTVSAPNEVRIRQHSDTRQKVSISPNFLGAKIRIKEREREMKQQRRNERLTPSNSSNF